MPRQTRRPGPPSFHLGVWGSGDTPTENIAALLDDFIEGLGKVTPKFVVPLDKELSTEAVLDVAQYALDRDYELQVVYEKKPTTKVLKEILVAAAKEYEAQDADDKASFVPTENPVADTLVLTLAEKPENARLLFLWNAEGSDTVIEDDERVLYAAVDSDIVVLDLTQGLDRLGADAAEEGGDESAESEADDDDDGAELEPVETVEKWAVRRIRTYAKTIAAGDREAGDENALDDDQLDEMQKDDLLSYLYPERGQKTDDEEPEDPAKGVTPKRARQMREESEAEGSDSSTRNRASGATRKAAATKEEPEEAPEPAEGDEAADDPLEAIREAMEVVFAPESTVPEIADAWADFADAFADVVIDRIAARVEKEPEGSEIRKEVAPPRPPGKPRKDGTAPTRRRTAVR